MPYVHLGIRLAADPLGYLDPLGFLPAPADPPPTPTPAPSRQPVSKPVHVPRHANGGGLVVEAPPAVPQPVAAPAEPSHAPQPRPEPKPEAEPTPKPQPAPAADTFRTDAPQIRRPVVEPVAGGRPAVPTQVVHAIAAEPLALSVAPGIVAAVLALVTAFMRSRRPVGLPANVIAFRKELPLRRAA